MRIRHQLFCTMLSALEAFFTPPSSVRGMKVLDKAAFRREVTLPAVFLQPSLCSKFLTRLQHVVLKYPRLKRIQTRQGDDGKVGHCGNETCISLCMQFLNSYGEGVVYIISLSPSCGFVNDSMHVLVVSP